MSAEPDSAADFYRLPDHLCGVYPRCVSVGRYTAMQGLHDAYEAGRAAGVEQGYLQGEQTGHWAGQQAGYLGGYEDAQRNSKTYTQGAADGYMDGYQDALADRAARKGKDATVKRPQQQGQEVDPWN